MKTDEELKNNEQPYIEQEQLEQTLQNVYAVLMTPRRRFYPNKSFGSRLQSLWLYGGETQETAALAAVRQALEDMDGVYAVKAYTNNDRLCVTLLINGMEGMVMIPINEENDGNS